MSISFNVTKDDHLIIRRIAERAAAQMTRLEIEYPNAGTAINGTRLELISEFLMDLTVCHANSCPLDLERLAGTDYTNFNHDVFGIRRHLNRETGKLENCFLPRFAHKQAA